MIEPGIASEVVVELAPGIRRITAANPGMMTGTGTNTYLVGTEEVAVIDPGPADEAHLSMVVAAGAGKIRWILATHTHQDHSPGAQFIKEATGAAILGLEAPRGFAQDYSFHPDRPIADGQTVGTGAYALKALHTPGHASNHLCFLLETEGVLFTGDHIKQDSTVVISPPDGDMAQYLDSLRRLLTLPLRQLAPGHGKVMNEPKKVLEWLIAHRLAREEKVLNALIGAGEATDRDLLPRVYDDVPPFLHQVAIRSLNAHLIKLKEDGKVTVKEEIWRAN